VIQAARGYPKTGFLNTLEHKALLLEIVSTRVASGDEQDDAVRPYDGRIVRMPLIAGSTAS
jgi:hypothetical protein